MNLGCLNNVAVSLFALFGHFLGYLGYFCRLISLYGLCN